MITLWRVFKTGFRNLFRHAWLSVAATAIMVVTLVVVSFFIFTSIFLRKGLEVVKQKFDITVYLNDAAKPDQIKDLQTKLQAVEDVRGVGYVNKQDVLEQYQNSSDPDKRAIAQGAITAGSGLEAILVITTNDLNKIDPIVAIIRDSEAHKVADSSTVDEGNVRKQNIEKIGKISNAAAKVGAVISGAFLVIALLVIFNTIRMAIFTRREEIEIMKLVGATKWFVRGPFIVEGALYGIIGATFAVLIIFPLLHVIEPFLIKSVGSSDVVKFITQRTLLVIGTEYLLGIVVGAVSSWLAISRHLKL